MRSPIFRYFNQCWGCALERLSLCTCPGVSQGPERMSSAFGNCLLAVRSAVPVGRHPTGTGSYIPTTTLCYHFSCSAYLVTKVASCGLNLWFPGYACSWVASHTFLSVTHFSRSPCSFPHVSPLMGGSFVFSMLLSTSWHGTCTRPLPGCLGPQLCSQISCPLLGRACNVTWWGLTDFPFNDRFFSFLG